MLNVGGISLSFGGRVIFDNFSFVVNPKERIGLIGKNGEGKSTMLKVICGIQALDKGAISTPKDYSIGYLPQEGILDSNLSLKEELETTFKDITNLEENIEKLTKELETRTDYESDDYMNLIQDLTDANERFSLLDGNKIESEVEKIAQGLGFSRGDLYRSCQEFSGGWKMRIQLAKILLSQPDLILLDEPTNHLDIESIIWLENFLSNYFGGVLIVSHDRRFLDNLTNRTIEISKGKMYDKKYKYSEFVQMREIEIEQQLNAQKNQQKMIDQTERFIERFKAKATLASRAQSRVKKLEKVERIVVDEVDKRRIVFRFPEPPRSSRLIVETKNLSKSYGKLKVLESIEFELERGDKVAFVGKNGMGKSTFSRIIAGEESFDGDIEYGTNIELGYYRQDEAQSMHPDATVFEIIDHAAKDDMRTKIRDLLGAFLFSGDDIYKKVKVLSGGERSRLAIAKMLLEPINFLIMDEPTNHLDMTSKDVLKDALLNFKGTLIVVSHDRDFLNGLTDKTIEFRNGKIKEYLGDIDYYLEKRQIENLDELDRIEKENYDPEFESEKSKNQISREEQKKANRDISRLEKLIKENEENIAKLESKKEEVENSFSDENVFNNPDLLKNNRKEIEVIEKKLERELSEWERNNKEFEKLIAKI